MGGDAFGLTVREIRRGSDEDLPPVETWRAGPLAVEVQGIEVRRVWCGEQEIVRGMFMAVRDDVWGTVGTSAGPVVSEVTSSGFSLRWAACNVADPIQVRWEGEIGGTATGEVSVSVRAEALADFDYCRIGLNVLHPPDAAGRRYHAFGQDGHSVGRLPKEIARLRFEGGVWIPLVGPYHDLAMDLGGGRWARFRFSGDLFEMEDQRNWTDASFKTYSTPLSLGYPHHAGVGRRFEQRVVVSVEAGDRVEGG